MELTSSNATTPRSSATKVARAIVTGGAGFIGSTLVDALLERGSEVLVIDNMSSGRTDNLGDACGEGVELRVLDIRDADAVTDAFSAFRPDTVFHLAAQIDVRRSMTDPGLDATINVVGSVNIFSAAVEAGVRRVVNTSTGGALYGDAAEIPTSETAPTAPASAYGLSKLTVERYARWFRQTHALDIRTLRYGNVYGPRQDPRGDAGVIARFCQHALNEVPPTIFGDGRQTRDFVFVTDVAAANLATATAHTLPETEYNIGTGLEVSLLDLVSVVAEAAGLDPEQFTPQYEPVRPGEVRRSCLDVSRSQRDLDLPSLTALRDGLRRTIAWIEGATLDLA